MEETNTLIEDYFDRYYKPVIQVSEKTILKTTVDLLNEVREAFASEDIKGEHIYIALQNLNYNYRDFSGTKRWMLDPVNSI